MPRLNVLKPGLLTTIQDAGRRGFEDLGVMIGGWMDDYASFWANRLLGNDADAAALEITLMGPELVADGDGWLALAGAEMMATIDGEPWPSGTSRHVQDGQRIRLGASTTGARAYLAAAGGFIGQRVFGSTSTDLVGGFGGLAGRAIRVGDVITYTGGGAEVLCAPVATWISDQTIRVLPGARRDRLPGEMWRRLLSERFRVSARSNRVGIRLEGPALVDTSPKGDAISEGMAVGAIQAPPSGELLILTKERGSIGGYPTLAHVIVADWPILAQLRPGQEVSFVDVDQDQAREALMSRRRAATVPLTLAFGGRISQRADPIVSVRAPIWSTVYATPRPEAEPFAPVGAFVQAGQTLAVLEVMKQFYDLESPVSGRIQGVHFRDGETIEEGTLLFEIDPTRGEVDPDGFSRRY